LALLGQPSKTRRRTAANAVVRIREDGLGSRSTLRAGSELLAVYPTECLGRSVTGDQAEDDAPPRLDQPACAVDQLLHHRLGAQALGVVGHRWVRPEQSALAHQSQDVHRQRGELTHKVFVADLPQEKARQFQFGLELEMKLLMGAPWSA